MLPRSMRSPLGWREARLMQTSIASASISIVCPPNSACFVSATRPSASPRFALRLASTGQLMAQGGGLVLPRLDTIPLVHRLVADDTLAVMLAGSLVELGIAVPEDWTKAEHDPSSFIGLTLGRRIEAHGGDAIRHRFILKARISSSPSAWAEEDEASPKRLFLTVEPSEAGCVVFGPTLELLEKCHPQMAATFFHLFVAALNRWKCSPLFGQKIRLLKVDRCLNRLVSLYPPSGLWEL